MVSVLLTVFNVAAYVEQAVRSVLAQTFDDFEIIVVDDGSTDGSIDKVKAIRDPRIRILRQQHAGSSAARNTAVDAARGELLAFLDGDDYWAPERLDRHVQLHESRPEIDMTYSLSTVVNEAGHVMGLMTAHDEGLVSFRELVIENSIRNGSCTMVRRAAMRRAGRFDLNLRACTDYDVWLRIADLREGNTYCIAEPLTFYRRRQGQITSRWNLLRESHDLVLRKFQSDDPEWPGVVAQSRCHMHRYYAFLAYEAGQRLQAIRLLLASFRLAPGVFLTDGRSWILGAAILSQFLLWGGLHRRLQDAAFALRHRLLERRLPLIEDRPRLEPLALAACSQDHDRHRG